MHSLVSLAITVFICIGCSKKGLTPILPESTLEAKLIKASPTPLLYARETAVLKWAFENHPPQNATFQVDYVKAPALYYVDVGQLSSGPDSSSLSYTAPEFVSEPTKIPIQIVSGELQTEMWVFLIPEDHRGISLADEDSGPFANSIASIYGIPVDTKNLFNISFSNRLGRSLVREIRITERSANSGFAGLTQLSQNFAIRMEGSIEIPTPGNYEFRLASDDGAQLMVDGRNVIDLDGVHGFYSKVGGPLSLKSGRISYRLDYFQASGNMGLILEWKVPGTFQFSSIPSSALVN